MNYQNTGPAHKRVKKLWRNRAWRAKMLRRRRQPRTKKQEEASLRHLEIANSRPKNRRQRASSRRTIQIAHVGLKKARKKPNGFCEICEEPCFTYGDHDHKTGKKRGRVCLNCNLVLGMFKDNPCRFRKAARYLEKYAGVRRFPRLRSVA